jgi:hypothetical protein
VGHRNYCKTVKPVALLVEVRDPFSAFFRLH